MVSRIHRLVPFDFFPSIVYHLYVRVYTVGYKGRAISIPSYKWDMPLICVLCYCVHKKRLLASSVERCSGSLPQGRIHYFYSWELAFCRGEYTISIVGS